MSEQQKEEGGKDNMLVVLSSNEVKNLFLAVFYDCVEEAQEFAENVKNVK